jgi:hypothetical protein
MGGGVETQKGLGPDHTMRPGPGASQEVDSFITTDDRGNALSQN